MNRPDDVSTAVGLSHELMVSLVGGCSEGVLVIGRGLDLIYCNEAAQQQLGFRGCATVGCSLAHLAPRLGSWLQSLATEPWPADAVRAGSRIELRGAQAWLWATAEQRVVDTGRVWILRITSRSEPADAALADPGARTVASAMALATHDLNNLLQGVVSGLELLAMSLHTPLAPDLAVQMSRLKHAAGMAARLVHKVMDLGLGRSEEPVAVQVDELVMETLEVLRSSAREVQLTEILNAGDAQVLVAPSDLCQILLNLVLNSVAASPPGAQVLVETGRVNSPASCTDPGRPAVLIRIRDEGCGIPVHALDAAFQSGTSMTQAGQHFGLGLAGVRDLIQKNRGALRVDSIPRVGTIFEIQFEIWPLSCSAQAS